MRSLDPGTFGSSSGLVLVVVLAEEAGRVEEEGSITTKGGAGEIRLELEVRGKGGFEPEVSREMFCDAV